MDFEQKIKEQKYITQKPKCMIEKNIYTAEIEGHMHLPGPNQQRQFRMTTQYICTPDTKLAETPGTVPGRDMLLPWTQSP